MKLLSIGCAMRHVGVSITSCELARRKPNLPSAFTAMRTVVRVPADAPPGAYKVEAGWYLLETLQRLPVLDATGATIDDKLLTGSVQVVP